MSCAGNRADAHALPSPADCATERGGASHVDPEGITPRSQSSDALLEAIATGRFDGDVAAARLSVATDLLADHRMRVAALVEDWRRATVDAAMTQRISTRANERAGHAVIELAPSLGRRRVWRVDGAKNDRRRAVLATGGEACGSGWRLTLEGWPPTTGGAGGSSVIDLARDALAAAGTALAILDAHAAVVAGGVSDDPRCADVRRVLEGLAHHDAAVRARPGGEPAHLAPDTIMLASTPWSKGALRHRFPHKGRENRGSKPKLPWRDFAVPGGVTVTVTDRALTLSPMRMSAGPHADPVARLRAIAALGERP